jgi:hypothetical protein
MPRYVRNFNNPTVFPQDMALYGCVSVSFVRIWVSIHLPNLSLAPRYHHGSKGLGAHQTAFAVHKFKSHCCVGLRSEIIALMEA